MYFLNLQKNRNSSILCRSVHMAIPTTRHKVTKFDMLWCVHVGRHGHESTPLPTAQPRTNSTVPSLNRCMEKGASSLCFTCSVSYRQFSRLAWYWYDCYCGINLVKFRDLRYSIQKLLCKKSTKGSNDFVMLPDFDLSSWAVHHTNIWGAQQGM